MSRFATIVFGNIASISKGAIGLRGSVFGLFAELELAPVEPPFLQSRKKEERSKHPIENLSEVSSQKLEKSCSG
jgi:hypothetical protein